MLAGPVQLPERAREGRCAAGRRQGARARLSLDELVASRPPILTIDLPFRAQFRDADGNVPEGQLVRPLSSSQPTRVGPTARLAPRKRARRLTHSSLHVCRSCCTSCGDATACATASWHRPSPSRRSSCRSRTCVSPSLPSPSPSSCTAHSRPSTRPQKLNTIKRCLIEVAKQGGPFTTRDLYPFQLALYQIDSLRKDGKFEGRDGSIPEGQGASLSSLSLSLSRSRGRAR